MNSYARNLRSTLYAFLLLAIVASGKMLAQVTVTVPDIVALPDSSVEIPINVSSVTGLSVIAFEFIVTCDPSILTLDGVDVNGTLSSGWGPIANNYAGAFSTSRMKVVAASSSPMAGSGVLIYLKVTAKSLPGSSPIQFESGSFYFNAGTPSATITTGSLRVNRPPTINTVGAKTVVQGDSLSFTVTATDPDLPNDTLTYTATNLPPGASFGASSGVFGWRPGYTTSGLFSVTFKVTDLGGSSDTTVASITVTKANQPPEFSTFLRDTTINEGSTLKFTYVAVDPDPGTSVIYGLASPPAGASITSDGALTFVVPANPVRTYLIIAIATDGFLFDTTRATVTINHKPFRVFRVPALVSTVSQNKSTQFAVSVTDPDGDALTYTWRLNGAVDKMGPDSTYTKSFADPHGAAKTLVCIFSDPLGAKDSTTWNFTITDISSADGTIPKEFALGQNYPNPFNPTTTIRFDLPREAPVTLEIYDVLGVRIRTLLKGETMSAGRRAMMWDGRDEGGSIAPSGVYLYRINAGDFQASKKMTLLK